MKRFYQTWLFRLTGYPRIECVGLRQWLRAKLSSATQSQEVRMYRANINQGRIEKEAAYAERKALFAENLELKRALRRALGK